MHLKKETQKPLKNNGHQARSIGVIVETLLIFIGLSWLAIRLPSFFPANYLIYLQIPLLLMQGLWLDRLYVVGHEATHQKLFPRQPLLNDTIGQAILLPILVPIRIYRKIHRFHHGFNRKDHDTSVLDVFVSEAPLTPLKKIWYKTLWYVGVFAGGYFFHSLASIIIFLFIPTKVAVRISPAFKDWSVKDRLYSWMQFLMGTGFHVAIYMWLGKQAWLLMLGYPILAFAWIWSMLVYIFHYDTTIGEQVRYNVRSLRRDRFFSWLLLNFNEHASHHMYPNIPWYRLPDKRQPLPEAYQQNQKVMTIYGAIIQQLKGPKIVTRHDITQIDL